MSSLAHIWSHKDGCAHSSTVKKLDFTAVRRLVRLKTVLYGHRRSLYGIVPCLTAPSRIILCWTKSLRDSFSLVSFETRVLDTTQGMAGPCMGWGVCTVAVDR